MPEDSIGCKVLLVDDEPDIRKLAKLLLQRAGYEVLVAENGLEGLAKAEAAHPEVVLLDVMMPGMSGFDVLKRLKENAATQDIPVIIFSALGADRQINMSRQLGAESHLEKPYQAQQLLEQVRLAIQKHRVTHESSSDLDPSSPHP